MSGRKKNVKDKKTADGTKRSKTREPKTAVLRSGSISGDPGEIGERGN